MAILIVEDLSDLAVGGAPLRWRGLAAAMAEHGEVVPIEVTAIRRDLGCAVACTHASTLVQGGADPYARYHCPRAAQAVADIVSALPRQPVVVRHLRLHRYLDAVLDAGQPDVALDLHNAEADLYEELLAHPFAVRWAAMMPTELRAIRAVEARACRTAKLVTVCSARDESLIRRRYAPAATAVIPNAVRVTPGSEPAPLTGGGPDLLFLGALEWFPNAHAVLQLAQEIFPVVKRVMPTATLTIAGAKPPPALRAWLDDAGITLIADPSDTRSLMPGRILVVPLQFGGGTRLKILEAFAAGCPVISTGKGAEGLAAQPGVHYLEANTARQFAAQLLRLRADPHADMRRRRAALDLVDDRYSWQAITDTVGDTLDQLRKP